MLIADAQEILAVWKRIDSTGTAKSDEIARSEYAWGAAKGLFGLDDTGNEMELRFPQSELYFLEKTLFSFQTEGGKASSAVNSFRLRENNKDE